MSAETTYHIGVDVGTASVRVCLVTAKGVIVASDTQDIIIWRDPHDHRIFEQSTDNIWSKICAAIKTILNSSNVDSEAVKGIGFDTTCSLAVVDFQGNPVMVTKGENTGAFGERNVILWADHRAEEEADLINSTDSVVLKYVGGTMSLEMEVPKILWLKKHMDSSSFSRCQFFDLPDYFTYKCTGYDIRSFCSTTCKCSFVPDSGWQEGFFTNIGLADLIDGGEWRQIGAAKGRVQAAGTPIGKGLTRYAAEEMGLKEGTAVGSGLIDAYAGWMGTVAARYTEDGKLSDFPSLDESCHRLAAVAGTSTCHLVQSKEGIFVQGVWGPYRDAAFPSWWMNEGGQSSTGQLMDFIINTHSAYPELQERAKQENKDVHQVLLDILDRLCVDNSAGSFTELVKDVHFYPDFHGNRSPIADSRMRGAIVGLELDASISDLARKYYLAIESISLQTRHIISSLNTAGHNITSLYLSGGQAKNTFMMQLIADTCDIPVILPMKGGEAVVLGAAMLGRIASEGVRDAEGMWRIMVEMTPPGTLVAPAASAIVKRILDAKYKIFLEMIDIQKRWRKEMAQATNTE